MHGYFKLAIAVVLILVAAQTAPAALAQDGNLMVAGKVPGGTVSLSRAQLQALPQHELTEQPMNFPSAGRFRGPLLADVLKLAGADAGDATLTALDDYKVTITADEMTSHTPILALDLDGVTLAGHDFGPYFVMWPFKEKPEIDNETFQAKAIWQVIRMDVQ